MIKNKNYLADRILFFNNRAKHQIFKLYTPQYKQMKLSFTPLKVRIHISQSNRAKLPASYHILHGIVRSII